METLPPPPPESGGSGRRRVVRTLLVVVVLVAAGLVALAFRSSRASSSELYLEPAASHGIAPFTPSHIAPAAPVPPPPTTETSEAPSTTTSTTVPPTTTTTAKLPSSSKPLRVTKVVGTTPGLYGGSGDQKVCDPDALVAFLGQHPDKAAAWVGALNRDPTLKWSQGRLLAVGDIPQYVSELRPVVLRYDTRVTNHGFVNGVAVPHQSVLQAGTAVLVDSLGVPRVRCPCGNPLIPPKRLRHFKWRGVAWQGVCEGGCEEHVPATSGCDNLDVIDPLTGQHVLIPCAPVCLARPCGTTTTTSEATTTTTVQGPQTSEQDTVTTRRRAFAPPATATTVGFAPPPTTTVETVPEEPPTTQMTIHYTPPPTTPTTTTSPPTTEQHTTTTYTSSDSYDTTQTTYSGKPG